MSSGHVYVKCLVVSLATCIGRENMNLSIRQTTCNIITKGFICDGLKYIFEPNE